MTSSDQRKRLTGHAGVTVSIVGDLWSLLSLHISALSPAPSCPLLCTPSKRRQNHSTAQGCPLRSQSPPLNRSSLGLSQALYFPPYSTIQHICMPFDLYNTTYFGKHFPNVKFLIPVPIHLRWQNTVVAITIMELFQNTHFYLIPQKWGTQLAFVQWLGDSHILNSILCISENPQYLGRFE